MYRRWLNKWHDGWFQVMSGVLVAMMIMGIGLFAILQVVL